MLDGADAYHRGDRGIVAGTRVHIYFYRNDLLRTQALQLVLILQLTTVDIDERTALADYLNTFLTLHQTRYLGKHLV